MINFNKKIKKNRACPVKLKRNGGMTYVELIVVLSIFAVMTSIVIFNYGKFQEKVLIKNYANDIALKMVEAQKSAMSGKWAGADLNWKPSYGLYFDNANDKSFIYFADLDNSNIYDQGVGEILENIDITKGIYIKQIGYFDTNGASYKINNLDITFTRPNSGAIFYSSSVQIPDVSYMQITITSPQGLNANIKVYSSGKVQIN